MTTEIVKDGFGTVVGSIETDAEGNRVLRSPAGVIRATYDASTDHTRDAKGDILAKGDALNRILC